LRSASDTGVKSGFSVICKSVDLNLEIEI